VDTTNGNHFYGFSSNDTAGAKGNVTIPCVANDTTRIFLQTGSIRTFGFTGSPRNSFGGFLIG